MLLHHKILSLEAVDRWVVEQRSSGLTIGFTCGSFDLFHAGHARYLAAARALCDRLIVAVNSDESVRRYKSPLRPISPLENRMYVIASLSAVDVVTVLEEDRPLALLLRWKPDYYIKGGDYSPNALRSAVAVREYGGRVEVIPPEVRASTTSILDRIAAISLHAPPEDVPKPASRGLILLDRDGTLIENVPFLHDPQKVRLLPGVSEGLARLGQAGFQLVIVTNQQGIGLGYYTTQDFIAVNQRLLKELSAHGAAVSRIYFCPHSAADGCECRKPAAGLLRRAMREFGTPPEHCYFIADSLTDAQAGRSAGCTTLLVGGRPVDLAVSAVDFGAAVGWILAQERSGQVTLTSDPRSSSKESARESE